MDNLRLQITVDQLVNELAKTMPIDAVKDTLLDEVERACQEYEDENPEAP